MPIREVGYPYSVEQLKSTTISRRGEGDTQYYTSTHSEYGQQRSVAEHPMYKPGTVVGPVAENAYSGYDVYYVGLLNGAVIKVIAMLKGMRSADSQQFVLLLDSLAKSDRPNYMLRLLLKDYLISPTPYPSYRLNTFESVYDVIGRSTQHLWNMEAQKTMKAEGVKPI